MTSNAVSLERKSQPKLEPRQPALEPWQPSYNKVVQLNFREPEHIVLEDEVNMRETNDNTSLNCTAIFDLN